MSTTGPVQVVIPARALIAMSARGVNIRDLILDELDPDVRTLYSEYPGSPCITGELISIGATHPLHRVTEPSVVFTVTPINTKECAA